MSSVGRDDAVVSRHSFWSDRTGNVSILFIFLSAALLLFTGGAVDFARYNAVRADLIEAMDAAGLAMAQRAALDDSLTDAELRDYGKRFFHENFRYDNMVRDFEIDFDVTQSTITPRVKGQIKTLFLGAGEKMMFRGRSSPDTLDFLSIDTDTEITRKGSGKIELALVLDVTGSMSSSSGGKKKIDSLRGAVDTMLQVMFGNKTTNDNLKVGIVPFNAYVNPGGASGWRTAWADANAEAVYHGAHFFHVDENGEIDLDTKVNHFELFNSSNSIDWMGCVEARPYPLDEMDTIPGQAAAISAINGYGTPPTGETDSRTIQAFNRAPGLALNASDIGSVENSRWVPLFVPDEPDCNGSPSACDYGGSGRVRLTINGNRLQLRWRGNYFDDPDDNGHRERDYVNGDFIRDYQYTYYREGDPFDHYLKIVDDFRTVVSSSYSQLDADGDALKLYFAALGATDETREEYIMRNSYVGWYDPANKVYDYKYDLSANIDESISDSDSYMIGPNRNCPAPILPLTNNRSTIESHMDTLYPNGTTNSANGAVWGWRTVSPGAPFTEGVAYDNQDWTKAVVIMTDGQNVVNYEDTHWGSSLTAYGFARETRMGAGIDDPTGSNGWFDSDEMRDHIDEKLLRICSRMKAQNILVYTIVFGLNDDDLEEVFQSCATEPGEPYYYKAPSGDELDAAFGNIAKDLVELHVSK